MPWIYEKYQQKDEVNRVKCLTKSRVDNSRRTIKKVEDIENKSIEEGKEERNDIMIYKERYNRDFRKEKYGQSNAVENECRMEEDIKQIVGLCKAICQVNKAIRLWKLNEEKDQPLLITLKEEKKRKGNYSKTLAKLEMQESHSAK